MTRNYPDDNTAGFVGGPRARLNAHNLELVKSGCAPSKGTGDWDVDYTSGTIIAGQSNGEVSVSAGTEDLADPTSDMSAGQERIVIVTINSSGNSNSVEGTPVADNPTTPDIPSGEVLIAHVHVQNSDSTLADSDLFDPRVIFGPSAYPYAIGTDTDHTAGDHESGGSLEVTHNNLAINADDHHTPPDFKWFREAQLSDTSTGNAVSWNPTGLQNRDTYKIRGVWTLEGTTAGEINLQISSRGGSVYDTIKSDGTTASNQTSWVDIAPLNGSSSNDNIAFEINLTGGALASQTGHIHMTTTPGIATPHAVSGRMEKSDNLDSINLTTTQNATMRAELLSANLA